MNMFNQDTCKVCGDCLSKCPVFEMPKEQARSEMESMIQGEGHPDILRNCAGCSYCDIVCPTRSNPSQLRKEILLRKSRDRGVRCLSLISEEVPLNIMTIGLEFEKEEKLSNLQGYLQPAYGGEVFYLGCSLSHIYTDLAKTKMLEGLPKLGGIKYCCGGYVNNNFGEDEAGIKGRQLLKELKKIGVEKMITFCPGCDHMLGEVYPKIIPEFDIKNVNIAAYLLQQYEGGKIEFTNPIKRKVTFHDSCAWRKMDGEVYESPRQLLTAMGAEVYEMKHNRRESLCCGTPLSGRNPKLASDMARKRVLEAKETGAEAIIISCTGCFALSESAEEQGLELYNLTELAQIALGETPKHRVKEIKTQFSNNLFRKISENPNLLKQRYVIKNGEVVPV